MATVEELLSALADAARGNEKENFDRLERELLAHFDGRLESMPREIYERYLDVDRHWPIAVEHAPAGPGERRTLQVRLSGEEEAWLQDLAVETDRSLSAVVGECIDRVRGDERLTALVRQGLERGRRLPDN